MSDPHVHQVLAGGLATLAIGCLLAFLRIVAALRHLANGQVTLGENQAVIATKAGVVLPNPVPKK